MLVKEWARLEGLHPQTVWKWCRQGTMPVPVEQTPTGMWLIHDPNVFCQIFVGRFGVSFSPFERLFLGRFGFGQSCGLSVIA